ncbi:MAG: hypothetical protein CL575_05140 [Altererythrobacter sp.]|nr:hypothetical protein [Altererythrobacter sp.]MAW91679.1 hypothetical protein [Altererythrobacter sp.]MBK62313.1 hypothetical protein [Altererythrobacter sp.]
MSRAARALVPVLTAILALGLPSAAAPQDQPEPIMTQRPAPTAPGELTFDSAPDLFPSAETKLVNGSTKVDLDAWQSLFIARLPSGGFCTATLVGPRVLLTAAHCVDAYKADKAATVGGRINIAGSQYRLSGCAMHPAYIAADRVAYDVPRASEDFALCELDGEPGITTETIATTPMLGTNSQMLLTGYGCTGIRVAAGMLVFDATDAPGAEKLRMGDARVDAVGVRNHRSDAGAYIRTRSVQDEPVLCPGDSGGPAIAGASLAQQKGPLRRVIGVNSMVTALPRGVGYEYLSFVASLGTEAFRDFLQDWTAGSANRDVCGYQLSPGQAGCRP